MGTDPSIKIRTLPRANEERIAQPAEASASSNKLLYGGALACCALMAFMMMTSKPAKPAAAKVQSMDSASIRADAGDKVDKYLHDSQLKSEMLAKTRQLENLNAKTSNGYSFDDLETDSTRNYGVQMDQEDMASKVFEDLNNDYQPNDQLPSDKINARLAKNRWTNEFERRERVTFVREYIRAAYEKGYEVQIDQNLVVVGVRKIGNQKVSIDQVLNKLAQQGL